jgi:ribosomal protein S18 acetylase RimI-like enzyme
MGTSDSDVRVSLAQPGDFLAVAQLDRLAWLDYPNGEVLADGEHTWRIWCELGLVVVAWAGAQAVGAALAFPCRDGRYCLHKLMVHREQQGRGIGKAVMRDLLDRLDAERRTAFLTVNPDNVKAVALYQSLGFTQCVRVEGYYRPDEHRLVLTRPSRANP